MSLGTEKGARTTSHLVWEIWMEIERLEARIISKEGVLDIVDRRVVFVSYDFL